MTFAEELEERGWTDGFPSFEEIVLEEFTSNYPAWTDETLLRHPTSGAAKFVKAVVTRTGITGTIDEKENLVLGILINNRKRNKERRESA